jgi:hypothetical protein
MKGEYPLFWGGGIWVSEAKNGLPALKWRGLGAGKDYSYPVDAQNFAPKGIFNIPVKMFSS